MASKAIPRSESNGVSTLDVEMPIKLWLRLNGSSSLVVDAIPVDNTSVVPESRQLG